MGVEKCNCESYTDYLCEFACSSKVCPGPESENCPVIIDQEEEEKKEKKKDLDIPPEPGL